MDPSGMLMWAGRLVGVANLVFINLLVAPLVLFYILDIMALQYQLAYYIPTACFIGMFFILFWSEPKQQKGLFIVKSLMPFIVTIIAGIWSLGVLIFDLATTQWNIVMNCEYAAYNVTPTDQLECSDVNWWWGFAALMWLLATMFMVFVELILVSMAALATHNFLSEGRFFDSMSSMLSHPVIQRMAAQAGLLDSKNAYLYHLDSRKYSTHKGHGQV